MDTSDGPDTSYSGGRNRRGGFGGGRAGGGGGYYDRDYQGGGGRGGGRYNDGYQGGGGRGRGGGYNDYNAGGRPHNDNGGGPRYQNNFGGGRYSFNDSYRGGGRSGGGGGNRGRGRDSYSWGRQSYQQQHRQRPPREDEQLPDDLAELTQLRGHTKTITCMAFEQTTQQLYTGSKDGTVKSWSCTSGQVTNNVDVGGEVDSLLLVDKYLFVGLHKGEEGMIKYWNMATGENHILTGHRGQVACMTVANGMLFSGGQDASIRVWAFNQQAGIFMPHAVITKDDGGHPVGVQALCAAGAFLLSGDLGGGIKVWDLASGQVTQSLPTAHATAITELMVYDQFILSCGMDGLIKAFALMETPQPGMVLRPDAEYTFDKSKDDDAGDQQQQHRRPRGGYSSRPKGVLTMTGVSDPAGTPILMASFLDEGCLRLFELPSFNPRGAIPKVRGCRALTAVQGQVLIAGDDDGLVQIFQWR